MFDVYVIPLDCLEPVVSVFRIPSVPQSFLNVLFPVVRGAVVMVSFGGDLPNLDEFFGDRVYQFVTLGVTNAAR